MPPGSVARLSALAIFCEITRTLTFCAIKPDVATCMAF
jgi:hypothetical protein